MRGSIKLPTFGCVDFVSFPICFITLLMVKLFLLKIANTFVHTPTTGATEVGSAMPVCCVAASVPFVSGNEGSIPSFTLHF
jgi:hypothetical protein